MCTYLFQRIRMLCLPTVEWGPALVKHRKLVDYVHDFVVDPWETGTKKEPQGEENWAMQYGGYYPSKPNTHAVKFLQLFSWVVPRTAIFYD